MHKIIYNQNSYPCTEQQTVLDVLQAHQIAIPSSCRSGVCQSCLMQASKGTPPAAAQKGLKDTLKAQNYFLACSCHPAEDMEVKLPDNNTAHIKATVRQIKRLSNDIVGVRLQCPQLVDYKPGQFINLFKDQTLARSYSLASIPGQDEQLELHIRRVPDGRMTGWIHEILGKGDEIEISLPVGDCFYTPADQQQAMLLIGTGTGLAPLYGIARDALAQGHTGIIKLYHGSINVDGLYLHHELRALAQQHANFQYQPCVSDEEIGHTDEIRSGHVLDIALKDHEKLSGYRIFLCGNPNMVKAAKRKTFLAGAAMKDIYADAFIPSSQI
jgi:NAD(P)H-flavin reductase/ferredoxin